MRASCGLSDFGLTKSASAYKAGRKFLFTVALDQLQGFFLVAWTQKSRRLRKESYTNVPISTDSLSTVENGAVARLRANSDISRQRAKRT